MAWAAGGSPGSCSNGWGFSKDAVKGTLAPDGNCRLPHVPQPTPPSPKASPTGADAPPLLPLNSQHTLPTATDLPASKTTPREGPRPSAWGAPLQTFPRSSSLPRVCSQAEPLGCPVCAGPLGQAGISRVALMTRSHRSRRRPVFVSSAAVRARAGTESGGHHRTLAEGVSGLPARLLLPAPVCGRVLGCLETQSQGCGRTGRLLTGHSR